MTKELRISGFSRRGLRRLPDIMTHFAGLGKRGPHEQRYFLTGKQPCSYTDSADKALVFETYLLFDKENTA
jgi:hypothetical protein